MFLDSKQLTDRLLNKAAMLVFKDDVAAFLLRQYLSRATDTLQSLVARNLFRIFATAGAA